MITSTIQPQDIAISLEQWEKQLGKRFIRPDFPRKIKKIDSEERIDITVYLNSIDPADPKKKIGETHQLMVTPIDPKELSTSKEVFFKWILVPKWQPPTLF